MKTLLLLRHAKSSWEDPSLDDFDRPLGPRGERAAPLMGDYLREEGLIPDVVLCSAARRTRQTWDLVRARLNSDPEVRFQRSLYLADPAQLLMDIHVQTDRAGTLLMIGHNPGTEILARRLAGRGEVDELERMSRKFPTAALAVLTCPSDHWSEVTRGTCTLDRFVRPKDLDED
jgi:phosphohistidine phosphatase